MNAVLSTEIAQLTPREKLSLIGELWDGLSEDVIPIPEWHKGALAEDWAHYKANPAEGSSWDAARARITGES